MRIIAFLSLAALALTAAVPALAQEQVYVPNDFEDHPGRCFYLFQDDAFWAARQFAALKSVSTDSVTPPASLGFSFPSLDGAPGAYSLDLEQVMERPEGRQPVPPDTVGLVFYTRGDGSAGKGRVELRVGDHKPSAAGADFDLADTKWRRVALAWKDMPEGFDLKSISELVFGLASGSRRPSSYRVDAVRFVTSLDEDKELAALAAKASENTGPFPVPDRPAVASCVYNKEGLAKAREKVKKGEPMKWVAYGDSVTVPVQLWNIPRAYQAQYSYYRAAANVIEKERGSKIETIVNAVGGRQLNENFQTLLDVLDKERPDVLVMHPWDTRENYETFMPRAQAAASEVGAEVLLVVPVYDAFPLRDGAIDWLRDWAREKGIAVADARTYLLATDKEFYWGAFFANPYHPGPEGHLIMSEVLVEIFR
jgi:hypothetical protein